MCLGVPGEVREIRDEDGTPVALVDFGGVTKEVCLAFTPEVVVGEYVIVHAGLAITRLDEDAARATLATLAELGGGDDGPAP